MAVPLPAPFAEYQGNYNVQLSEAHVKITFDLQNPRRTTLGEMVDLVNYLSGLELNCQYDAACDILAWLVFALPFVVKKRAMLKVLEFCSVI